MNLSHHGSILHTWKYILILLLVFTQELNAQDSCKQTKLLIASFEAQKETLKNELTNLVTENGKYLTSGVFGGGQGLPYSIIGSRAVSMCPLSSMAFNRGFPG